MPPKKTSPTGRRKTTAVPAKPRKPRAAKKSAGEEAASPATLETRAPTIADYAGAEEHPAFATSPLGVLLGVAQDEAMPIALRVQAAKAALPFVHRRRASEKTEAGDDDTPAHERELERLLAIPDAGGDAAAALGADKAHAAAVADDDAPPPFDEPA